MDKVGKDGVITVEESKGLEFETEYVEGMQLDRGYLSPYFVTNSERMEAVVEDPYILITDKKIAALQDIVPTLEKLVQLGKPSRCHRRRCGRRSTGDSGPQQAAWDGQCVAQSRPLALVTAARPCWKTSLPSRAARSSPKPSVAS